MRTRSKLSAVVAALAATAAVSAAPRDVRTAAAASPAIDLQIRIAARSGKDVPRRTWRLRCRPNGGDWPSVAPACRRLKREHLATIEFETKDYTRITSQPVRITGRAFGKTVSLTFPSNGSGTRRARLLALRSALGPNAFREAERRSR